MKRFFCKDSAGVVLKVYDLDKTSLSEATLQCAQLRTERSAGSNSKRKDGKPVALSGGWKSTDLNIKNIDNSSPESRQYVPHNEFQDLHAWEVVGRNTVERLDYVANRASKLDFDDKEKLYEQMMRDTAEVIRALVADIYHLQSLVGELMVRVDSLESWDKGSPPFDDLTGSEIPMKPMLHDPYPHTHGGTIINTPSQDSRYHQGKAVYWESWGESPGLARYHEAMKEAGIPLPDSSPENKYSQSGKNKEFK